MKPLLCIALFVTSIYVAPVPRYKRVTAYRRGEPLNIGKVANCQTGGNYGKN
jgi:hypothetical protein